MHQFPKVRFYRVNFDKQEEIVKEVNIRAVCYCSSLKIEALTTSQLPTFKVYKKGELFDELPCSNPVGLFASLSIPLAYAFQ